LRTAVIGVGRFGRFHAQKYAQLPRAELVAVVDADANRAGEVAASLHTEALTDYRQLYGRVDAVSVAVPTAAHFAVARDCLQNGIHVLLEKPMTANLQQADTLIAEAAARRLVLQVGYLERFALIAAGVDGLITRPLFIECSRIAPFQPRSLDVSVVYDVMIHDIDMVLAMVPGRLESVEAVGAPVLSAHEDIANTRLRFADGCVVNITASRISLKSERKMRIFQPDGYLSIDFLARKVSRVRRPAKPGGAFEAQEHQYEDTDVLLAEIASFLAAAAGERPPAISGLEGRRALEAAVAIDESLRAHRARMPDLDFAANT
jgi:predicted dehydrogenase